MSVDTKVEPTGAKGKPRRLRRWLLRIVLFLVIASALGGGLVGVAEHHTSQPEFCASCHIMGPYYASWKADLHGGKLDVACVECHYAPGERTTIKAKLRGLSQVASYVSGRYGATRPRAQVADSSCLTSKCHGDKTFMDKPQQLGTVRFVHSHHLQRTDGQERPKAERLAELQASLEKRLGKQHFAELESAACESGAAVERYGKMESLCRGWNADVGRDTLIEFSQLHHRSVRLAQLKDLHCVNCHSYHSPTDNKPGVASSHFQVSTTTCFTCHFNNEGFNIGTSTCLMCHTPPQTEITVHEQLPKQAVEGLKAPELAEKTVKMNHADIVARKVDCISCHADVAREDSVVARRDCEQCHDQPRFFAEFKQPFTLELVTKYHALHVPQQRAKCLDCHSEIHHRLVRGGDKPEDFLSSTLANCTSCHPNHHREQILLLTGSGGQGAPNSAPNPMFGARTNCYGCHSEHVNGLKEGEVVKATVKTCVACHSERYGEMLEKWKAGVQVTLEDAEKAFADAKKVLEEKTAASPEARQKAVTLLNLAEADLRLVKRGNGIHNVTYAVELLDAVTSHCQQATAALEAN